MHASHSRRDADELETARQDLASRGIDADVAVCDVSVRTEAEELVRWAHGDGGWKVVRRRKQQPVGLTEEQHAFTFAAARAQLQAKNRANLPAPIAALDAIEKGCNLPFENGLRIESERFIPLVGSPMSRNLISVFFASQRTRSPRNTPHSSARKASRSRSPRTPFAKWRASPRS